MLEKQYFKCPIEEEKAIVTNIPGTTRDIVEGKFL